SDVLEVVAVAQVVIADAEGILFAAGDRAAPGDTKNGGPFDRVWLAVADAKVAEHAPAARFVRGIHPERLVKEISHPPRTANGSRDSRWGKMSSQDLREESQRLRGDDGIAAGAIDAPEALVPRHAEERRRQTYRGIDNGPVVEELVEASPSRMVV